MKCYDTLVIGGGPAGLCAAINGASEGMRVAILDAEASLGGQARESRRVENYPMPYGMHDGVPGDQLMGGFIAQAAKFGVDIYCPVRAANIRLDGHHKIVTTTDFQEVRAKCVILSTGLSYRRLDARNLGRFMGRGVWYGLPGHMQRFRGKACAVVGAANSAGQAVLKVAETASKAYLLARSPLEKSMSQYLIDRIKAARNIEVIVDEVCGVGGNGYGTLCHAVMKGGRVVMIDCLFVYIGAVPHTAWLMGHVELDEHKFILTDVDLGDDYKREMLPKPYLPCETSMPGVFAAGDVRRGQAVKRITGAIGDGITALQSCHRYCSSKF